MLPLLISLPLSVLLSPCVRGSPSQRVFIHYVLGKMLLLFFLCHPGTLATCDGQAYLRNRYANRDLVKTEAELVSYLSHRSAPRSVPLPSFFSLLPFSIC